MIEEFQTAERNLGCTSLKRELSLDLGCPMFARFWQTWDPARRQELRMSQLSSQKALAEPGAPCRQISEWSPTHSWQPSFPREPQPVRFKSPRPAVCSPATSTCKSCRNGAATENARPHFSQRTRKMGHPANARPSTTSSLRILGSGCASSGTSCGPRCVEHRRDRCRWRKAPFPRQTRVRSACCC